MLPPGFLSKQVKGIEKEKQKTIKQLITELRAAGIEDPSKFFFRSNQQSNGKGTDKRKNKIGRGDGDEDYEPFNGEEGLSDDDDNDDSSRSKAKKVKRVVAGKKNGGSIAQEKGSSPHEATQALQLPTSPTEQTDSFCSPHTDVASLARTRSDKPIRKRGPTKLKTIAIDGGSRIKVSFDEKGLPIGEESIKLSSFYGALVREIVPFTLSDWRKLSSAMAEVLWQSIQRVTTNPNSSTCKLLDWMGTGEVVAEGRWSSSDPNDCVHHIPLGPNTMRVWVDLVKKREVYLWRPTSDMLYIEDAEGTTVAWPADKVLMDSTPRSMD